MFMTEKSVLWWKGTQLPVEHLVVLDTTVLCSVKNPQIQTIFLTGSHLEKRMWLIILGAGGESG